MVCVYVPLTPLTSHQSVFGWGLSGVVAKAAAKLRWVPGQRAARYDIAGFVTMLKEWPVLDKGTFSYLDKDGNWVERPLETINLTATKMSHLGDDHPIYPGTQNLTQCWLVPYPLFYRRHNRRR